LILAGGRGTRLGERTNETPKPLLPVGGAPFLQHLIWNLRRHGVGRIVVSTGYLAHRFKEVLGDGRELGVEITYCQERDPLGTGGALKWAAELLEEVFYVLNGDTLFDVNYLDMPLHLRRREDTGFVALRRVNNAARYGTIDVKGDRIVAFREKDVYTGAALVNAGVYLFRKEILRGLPDGPSSLEQDLLPRLADRGELTGAEYQGYFLDIGLPETLEQAERELPVWRRKPAIFFDRDGVLNKDHGYTHRIEDWVWMPGAPDAIKWANDQGYLVFVVTNQSGIARGYFTDAQFLDLMGFVQKDLCAHGAHLDDIRFCPHHPDGSVPGLASRCECRKPGTAMIEDLLESWGVDRARSLLVGDSESDIAAGRAAGVQTVRFQSGDLRSLVRGAVGRTNAPCARSDMEWELHGPERKPFGCVEPGDGT
jgi:D-glycero-D-manno-heptose 1,7-bisphosphate phosphatase